MVCSLSSCQFEEGEDEEVDCCCLEPTVLAVMSSNPHEVLFFSFFFSWPMLHLTNTRPT